MNAKEFLSILSSLYSGVQLSDFEKLDHIIDIYDFKKNLDDVFSVQLNNKLSADKSWFDRVICEYELIQKNGITLLYPGHSHYPSDFLQLEKPPLFLTAKGNLSALFQPRVSVVGSRHASQRVLDWMDVHLTPLVQEGCALVSGAARGIDQRAHLICLRQKKPTIAFLPSGILQTYPSEFEKWFSRIEDFGGLILSEYALQQNVYSHHFHERNRMIAKLGYFLIVCEARRKSGSIMTARLAIENHKTVCVLPGFPTETNNQGCVDLLFQGAFPIRDFIDLRELYALELIKCYSTIPNSAQRIDC